MKFKTILCIPLKKAIHSCIVPTLDLYNALGSIVILNIFNIPLHEQRMCFYFLVI